MCSVPNPADPLLLPRLHCKRCHHTWIPRRTQLPKRCPGDACNTILWNISYKRPDRLNDKQRRDIWDCPVCRKLYRWREAKNPIDHVDKPPPTKGDHP